MKLVLTAIALGTVFMSATALVPAASLAAKVVDEQAAEPVKTSSTQDMVASRKRTLLDLLGGSDSGDDSEDDSDDDNGDDSDDDNDDDDDDGDDDHGGDDHGGRGHGGDDHGGHGNGGDD